MTIRNTATAAVTVTNTGNGRVTVNAFGSEAITFTHTGDDDVTYSPLGGALSSMNLADVASSTSPHILVSGRTAADVTPVVTGGGFINVVNNGAHVAATQTGSGTIAIVNNGGPLTATNTGKGLMSIKSTCTAAVTVTNTGNGRVTVNAAGTSAIAITHTGDADVVYSPDGILQSSTQNSVVVDDTSSSGSLTGFQIGMIVMAVCLASIAVAFVLAKSRSCRSAKDSQNGNAADIKQSVAVNMEEPSDVNADLNPGSKRESERLVV
jgi:hypothetical protein